MEIIDYDQPAKDIKTYEIIRTKASSQGGGYRAGCLLDYLYFKLIAIEQHACISEQHVLDADPKEIQNVNLTVNLDRSGDTTLFLILEEVKETIMDFSQRTVRVL